MRMRSFQVCECGAPLHVSERETPKPEGAQVPTPIGGGCRQSRYSARRLGLVTKCQAVAINNSLDLLVELVDDFDGRAHVAAHLVACDKLAQEQSRSEHCWKTVSGPPSGRNPAA